MIKRIIGILATLVIVTLIAKVSYDKIMQLLDTRTELSEIESIKVEAPKIHIAPLDSLELNPNIEHKQITE